MRSIYAKALLWSLGILLFSLGAFLAISRTLTYRNFDRGTRIGTNAAMQFEEALLEYQNGGAKALSDYLGWQHALYPQVGFFFVKDGRDLVTGADLSEPLATAKSIWNLIRITQPIFIAIASDQSEYTLMLEISPQELVRYLPYYVLLVGAIAILCWVLAIQFASPLVRLAETVRRFGAGDLSARVRPRRHDEIGAVGKAFDQMAERMETLITSERRLLQDISHELRSPLARLSFAAELARTSPDRDAAARRVSKEIDRLTDLVQSLLQVTRTEGELSLQEMEIVDLDSLVQELIEDCQIEAAAGGCRLIAGGTSGLDIRADRELLRRAIENVLRNAIQHAPRGSSIDVVCNATEEWASVSIRDHGVGVPAETLTQIFEPFFRVDRSRNAATGGVGLGLAIAQRAIHVHHGRIWARNAGPGLQVCIELPALVPAQGKRRNRAAWAGEEPAQIEPQGTLSA